MDNPWVAFAQWNDAWAERFSVLTSDDVEEYMQQRNDWFARCQQYEVDPEQREQLRPIVARLLRQDEALLEKLHQLRDEASSALTALSANRKRQDTYAMQDSGDVALFFDRRR